MAEWETIRRANLTAGADAKSGAGGARTDRANWPRAGAGFGRSGVETRYDAWIWRGQAASGDTDKERHSRRKTSAENEALWHAVFEEGEDGAGSFNLIRNGTFLARVSETEFEVVAKTSFAKRFAEQKRGQLESIMERKLGRGLRMICVEEKDYHALQERQGMDETCAADGSVPDPETEHLMQLAKDALGIEIEIE